MLHSTPEKARTVKLLLSNMSVKDRVVVVNTRTSSAMRWSGCWMPVLLMRGSFIR